MKDALSHPHLRALACLLLLPLSSSPSFGATEVTPNSPNQNKRSAPKFQRNPGDASLQPIPPAANAPVEFVGNRSFTPDQLRTPLAESLKDIQANGLTRPRADDAAYFLSVYYRKQGYPDVEVNWDIRGSRLVLTIKEGPHTLIGQVTFEGNSAQTNATLYEYMIGGTQEKKVAPVEIPFVEADVQSGVARIRGLYESEGFLDAIVDDAVITYSGDHTRANLVVNIKEGPKYVFGNIVFTGTPIFERERLIKALKESTEAPYTTQRVNTMQKNLEYFYKLQGYYTAEVTVASDPKAARVGPSGVHLVTATFTAKPGPLYRFDGVTINKLDRLKPAFIQNRFRKLKGKVYSPPDLDETYREVLRTGLFNNLRLKTTPLPATNEVRVDLEGQEAKAKEIGFSVGFSTYEGFLVGLRLADRDIFGIGRPLSLDIDYTSRAMRAELLYVDPWWLETDNNLRARIFLQSRDEIGYSKNEQGIRGDITRTVNRKLDENRKNIRQFDLTAFLSIRNVNITESTIEPQFLGATSYQIATLGVSETFDFRDSPVNPSRGVVIALGVDADAIAGEVAFARTTGRITYFIPLPKKYLLALGARGGLILPFTSVPIDERFFNGGGSTVRSFRERRLGPMDKGGNPIGGEVFTVFNAELEIPIKDALYGAVFIDAGNVVSSLDEASLNEMRYGVGIGVRYNLPIGPIRLDVAANPNRKANEDWGAVQFSFGFAF